MRRSVMSSWMEVQSSTLERAGTSKDQSLGHGKVWRVEMNCGYTGIGSSRCKSLATVWLFDSSGQANPGGYLCQKHVDLIITEYRDKLGEEWTTQPIDENGSIIIKEIGNI